MYDHFAQFNFSDDWYKSRRGFDLMWAARTYTVGNTVSDEFTPEEYLFFGLKVVKSTSRGRYDVVEKYYVLEQAARVYKNTRNRLLRAPDIAARKAAKAAEREKRTEAKQRRATALSAWRKSGGYLTAGAKLEVSEFVDQRG